MFGVAQLQKIAAYGAVISVGGCFIMYYKMQENMAKGDYYKKSIEALRSNEKLCDALGPPVRTLFLKLGDNNNFITADKAQLSIPIRGSKYKGILLTRCEKIDNEWQIVSLNLNVNNRTFPVLVDHNSDDD